MRRKILLIEFEDGRPFHVAVDDGRCTNFYDFDWCERAGVLAFSSSGFGGEIYLQHDDNPYWVAEGVQVQGNPALQLTELPAPYQLDTLFSLAVASETEWCETCKSYILVGLDGEMCGHIRWCDECAWWSTPSEPCRCPEVALAATGGRREGESCG